jgi:serine O-acetyltransferase
MVVKEGAMEMTYARLIGFDRSLIAKVVDALCDEEACRDISRQKPMPSVKMLVEIVELLREVIFPGYFGFSDVTLETRRFHVGATLDRVTHLLVDQVRRGYCFTCAKQEGGECDDCVRKAQAIATAFIQRLPGTRDLLAADVRAAYEGDPAAVTPSETIFCYPSVRAMTNFRVAHELLDLGTEIIPRIMTEIAHSETGIDIHPGATIGERFFMDHGTGIVIGETSVIGRNVRIYQGVTLGAKSLPLDEHGRPAAVGPRHPVVEDDVVIYANATLLGRITIGRGAVIGGNTWVTQDVPAGARVVQTPSRG